MNEIIIESEFEKFDYHVNHEMFVDFKNWDLYFFNQLLDKQKEKISRKASFVNAKSVFIINCFFSSITNHQEYDLDNGTKLVVIPWLYDTYKNRLNVDAINIIRDQYINRGIAVSF